MRRAFVVLALLLAAPFSGAWRQSDDPGRTGIADLPAIPDVVANFRLAPQGETLLERSQVIETDTGLLSLVGRGADQDRTCQLSLASASVEPRLLGQPFACPPDPAQRAPDAPASGPVSLAQQGLVAVDRDSHVALICLESATNPLLAFDDRDGSLLWSLAMPTGLLPLSAPGPSSCGLPAIGDGIAYVPFWGERDQSVAAIRLSDHVVLWSRPLGVEAANGVPPPNGTFFPVSITMTDGGIVVLGSLGSPYANAGSAGFRSFTFDGRQTTVRNGATYGLVYGVLEYEPPLVQPPVSRWAGVQGALAAFTMNGFVILVNPTFDDNNILLIPYEISPTGVISGGVAWSDEDLVVPLDYFLVTYHGTEREGKLFNYGGLRVGDVVLDGHRQALALYAVPSGAQLNAAVVVRDLASGADRQRLLPPIRQVASYTAFHVPIHLQGLANGALVWSDSGDAALLGQALHKAPQVKLSNAYPALGETVTLTPTTGGSYQVAWGDRFDDAAPGPFERAFHAPGDTRVRITELFEDGTTATTEVVLHVGKDPPQDLNFLQKAFARDNQDWTFFVLGLAITLAGTLLAIAARRRSQSRIHAELAELDQIAKQGDVDPVEARRDLDDFERSLRLRLANGQLRDTQYDILDRRARDVRKDLR